jgi:hypothetical protein
VDAVSHSAWLGYLYGVPCAGDILDRDDAIGATRKYGTSHDLKADVSFRKGRGYLASAHCSDDGQCVFRELRAERDPIHAHDRCCGERSIRCDRLGKNSADSLRCGYLCDSRIHCDLTEKSVGFCYRYHLRILQVRLNPR